jgi:hypothetical protein
MQTEFDFTLPRGYLDEQGQVHRQGRMRLATAGDEVEAAGHPYVQGNDAYLPMMLLSQVITQLGELASVSPQVIAGLFASDLLYLEDLYLRLNGNTGVILGAVCPHCGNQFQIQVAPLSA